MTEQQAELPVEDVPPQATHSIKVSLDIEHLEILMQAQLKLFAAAPLYGMPGYSQVMQFVLDCYKVFMENIQEAKTEPERTNHE